MKILNQVNHADTGALYGWQFWCPGCQDVHTVGAAWEFNGDQAAPTFSPSVLVTYHDERRCHSHVTDGKITFLSDCTHALAGAAVPLPEWRTA